MACNCGPVLNLWGRVRWGGHCAPIVWQGDPYPARCYAHAFHEEHPLPDDPRWQGCGCLHGLKTRCERFAAWWNHEMDGRAGHGRPHGHRR